MMDVKKLRAAFPDAILNVEESRGDVALTIDREALLPVCAFLRDDPDYCFRFLVDVTAVDHKDASTRFVAVYHLLSHEHNQRLRLKVPLDNETPEIESVVGIWPTANWHEREAYDLLGIQFLNHPDLRRILLPYHWNCHPLRKDYPLEGNAEE